MAVRWNNEYSDSFGVSNGVKHGGVLSPILFCIYIDNLLMSSGLSDDKDIMHQTSMYNRKANAVLSDFKHISGDLRVNFLQSYCSSFYGSQLWDLSNKCIDRLCISWRKAITKA